MTNALTVFATYWNEKDWIDTSLAQIDRLNPQTVMVVDGCYDPRYKPESTDGTSDIIAQWADSRPHVTVIPAVRKSRLGNLWYLFGHRLTWLNIPLRIFMAMYYARTNVYRLNQASTFTYMLRNCGAQTGSWIMHNDSDQFYPDDVLQEIIATVNDPSDQSDLITADEITFVDDFSSCTTEYEKRNYNNLPYRLKKNTLIVPTRDVVTEMYPRPKAYGKDTDLPKKHLGTYHHYKFRPTTERDALTYNVGDRKKPDYSKFTIEQYTGLYPQVIRERFTHLAKDPEAS